MPTTDGAGRSELSPVNVSGLPDCGGGGVDGGVDGVWDGVEALDTGYGMLAFESAFAYASTVLPALRTHTATREAELAAVGAHVHWLLEVHCCMTIQFAPS
jgi:hypothetical protein